MSGEGSEGRWDERGRRQFDKKPAAKLDVRHVVLVTRLGPSSQVSGKHKYQLKNYTVLLLLPLVVRET